MEKISTASGVPCQITPVLELKDVSILVPSKPQEIVLLGDISTSIQPGQFVAVVGPSGCGKSTLLKVIAGICEPTFGGVNWNGRDLASEGDLAPHEIGYVPQFSIAYDLLTVEENLLAAVKLRVSGLSSVGRRERVASILQQAGLQEIADRQVRVLSGGQRRRLALALEMVTSPQLLLCDEVTSGLDPKAEDDLVALMRTLSRQNRRTILNVTHSLRNLAAYDAVIVLVGGQLAYHGPPEFLTHYFQIREPAELFKQLGRRKPDEWHRSWKKHREPYQSAPGLKALAEQEPGVDRKGFFDKQAETREDQPVEIPPLQTPGAISQFFTLLGRRWRLFFRDSPAVWLQLALLLGFPCLVVVFALDGLPQIQNLSTQMTGDVMQLMKEKAEFATQAMKTGSLVSGLVMFQIVLLTLMGSNNAAREIAGERPIFEKEKFGGLRPAAYVASKAAFLLFLVLAQSVWMGVFVNAVCRFPGDLVQQIAVLTLANAAMTAVCLAISSFSRTAEQASLTSIYLVGFQLPLSGAVLALPKLLGIVTGPLIAAYWGWSGFLQTLRDSRFYDVVKEVSRTTLSPLTLCLWVLGLHVVVGLFASVTGCKNSRWE